VGAREKTLEGEEVPDIPVEEAVRQNCQALMTGDVMGLMGAFTPEALAALMATAPGITSVPSVVGYEIRSHQEEGDEHKFTVAFETSAGEVLAHSTWKDVGGLWKITALTVDGL
jgi:hypothetical protein